MRNLIISDLHGKSFKTIYEEKLTINKNIDNIILLGDYFDSENIEITGEIQLKRFLEILELQRKDNRIKILLGNHDAFYLALDEVDKTIFKHILPNYRDIQIVLNTSIQNIDIAFESDKWLFSHQGITKSFMQDTKCNSIQALNEELHNKNYEILYYKMGLIWICHNGGRENFNILKQDKYQDFQVVGHYKDRGLSIYGSIICLEDVNHGNGVIIED